MAFWLTHTFSLNFISFSSNIKAESQHKNTHTHSYLLQFAIAGANKRHGVAMVVIRRHRGHAIVLVDEERDTLNGAGPPQRLVEVLATEVIVDLQRLEGGGKGKMRNYKNIQASRSIK